MRSIPCWLHCTMMILATTTTQAKTGHSHPSHQAAPPAETSSVNFIQTSFELGGDPDGILFIDVRLNGENERFVLDTGAPALILNAAHFVDRAQADQGSASGVSGPIEMSSITIESLDWHGIQKQNTEVIGVDLSHLETATKSELVGLIGFNTVKDFELLIDYPARQLTLFRPGASNLHRNVRPLAEVPFVLEAHIPVVDVVIGGKSFRLGLDTGAAVNLLDPTAFDQLDESTDYTVHGEDVLHGADKNAKSVQVFNVKGMQVAGTKLEDMRTTVADISHLNNGYGLEVDGLVGYPFLSQQRMSINFADQKLYLWDPGVEVTRAPTAP